MPRVFALAVLVFVPSWLPASIGEAASPFGSWQVVLPPQAALSFYGPTEIAVGSDGTAFVFSTGTSSIQRVPASGPSPAPWALPADVAKNLTGLTVNSHKTVYISTDDQAGIRTFSPDGKLQRSSKLGKVQSVAVDASDTVYALQQLKDTPRISRLSSTGAVQGSFAATLKMKLKDVGFPGECNPNLPCPGRTTGPFADSLAVGRDGTIYDLLDVLFPDQGNLTAVIIQKRSSTGAVLAERQDFYNGLAVAPDGSVLGWTNNDKIYKLGADLKISQQWRPLQSCPASPLLKVPTGIATDAHGNIFVTYDSQVVEELSSSGAPIHVWGSCPLQIQPDGIAVNQSGSILMSGHGAGAVESDQVAIYSQAGGRIAAWGTPNRGALGLDLRGNIYVPELQGAADGVAKYSPAGNRLRFFRLPYEPPNGVTVDARGNVYATETGSAEIIKFGPGGKRLAAWGKHGTRPGQFNAPLGLATDASGNVYVADQNNYRVQKLSPAGKPLAQWSTSRVAGLRKPVAVAVDSRGNVWVACEHGILALSPAGAVRGAWTSKGVGPGSFDGPQGVAVDRAGNVYVSDTNNDRVQRLAAGRT
jgi:streptogramin lyase